MVRTYNGAVTAGLGIAVLRYIRLAGTFLEREVLSPVMNTMLKTPGIDTQRYELHRRLENLKARHEADPLASRNADLVEETRLILRELQELDLDDLLRSSMEGGSEAVKLSADRRR